MSTVHDKVGGSTTSSTCPSDTSQPLPHVKTHFLPPTRIGRLGERWWVGGRSGALAEDALARKWSRSKALCVSSVFSYA